MVPAVLSAALVFALREPRGRPRRRPRARRGAAVAERTAARRRSGAWSACSALFSLVNFPDALLLLRLHDIGFSVVAVILAYVGYNLVYAAAQLSRRRGRPTGSRPRCVVAVGLLVFAVAYAGLGLTREPRSRPGCCWPGTARSPA